MCGGCHPQRHEVFCQTVICMPRNAITVARKTELAVCTARTDVLAVKCKHKALNHILARDPIIHSGFRQSILKVAIAGLFRFMAYVGIRCHVQTVLACRANQTFIGAKRYQATVTALDIYVK